MAGIIYTPPPVTPTPPTFPGGAGDSVQFNDSSTFNGAGQVFIDGTKKNLEIAGDNSNISSATNQRVRLWANNNSVETKLWINAYKSVPAPVQHEIGYKQIGWIQQPTASAFNGVGSFASVFGVLGTYARVSKGNFANKNLPNYTYGKLTSTAVNNAGAELYGNSPGYNAIVSDNPYAGGAYATFVFGFPTYRADQRIFVGYTQNNAAIFGGAGDPSAFLNMVGVGKDRLDGTLHLMSNDTSGAANKIDTGFIPTADTAVYRLTVNVLPGTNRFSVQLDQWTDAGVSTFTHTFNSKTPPLGTNLYVHAGVNTALTASAVTIGIIQIYEEQY